MSVTLIGAMARVRHLLRVLRHRDFRLLWLANSASAVGDRIVMVALALFVVQLTGSATDVGLVLAAYNLPLIVFLLVGGVVADRFPRHRVAVATDVARCALHGLLAVLIVTGEVRISHLVAIGVVFGTAEAFYRPAASGLLPQTVPEDEIQQANAATMMFENIAEVAGPALATVLVLGFSPAAAFGLDAATFAVSAALLVRIRPRERGAGPAAAESARSSVRADLRAGFQEVRSRAWVWVSLTSFCAALFCVLAPLFVLGPIVAEERYGDLAVFGYIWIAFGAGTITGSLAALRWRPRYPLRYGIALILLWPAAIALYAAGVALEFVVPAMAIAGIGASLFDVWWVTALAERIPPDKLSRVTSYDWAVSLGLMPLGFVLAGPAGHALGATTVLLGGALIAIVALALALAPRETRMLARLEAAPAPVALADVHPRLPTA
jgi:MFS family permease